MAFSSTTDKPAPLVLDTSALINLHASSLGREILSALRNDVWIPAIILEELERTRERSADEIAFLHDLVKLGLAQLAYMSEAERNMFGELTAISPSLDDGEAGTIAIAARRFFIPVVDEQKGRARAASLTPPVIPAWSLDLFRDAQVVGSLGQARVTEALFQALLIGRMRIPELFADEIIAQIGQNRASECTSLPNYRRRFRSAITPDELRAPS